MVKKLGAIWNLELKKWTIKNNANKENFLRWLPIENEFDYLFIDLIPHSAWFSNLRSELNKENWDIVRKFIYARANNRCEICGGKGLNHPVEAHERWGWDTKNKIQVLIGIQALCPNCHEATHMGLAQIKGRYLEAKKHLKKINNWNEEKYLAHEQNSVDLWEDRNKIQNWKLNLVWLKKVFNKDFAEIKNLH